MKPCMLPLALAVCLPSIVLAQDDTRPCWDCTLSLSDTGNFSAGPRKFGFWDTFANPQKTLYLGIVYSPTATFDGLTGIELSIQGLPEIFLAPSVTVRDDGIQFGDSIETPADPTLPGATGGWNVVWSECQPGNRVLIEIAMISFDPIPNDTVIRVLPKFPPTNSAMPHSLFTLCNFPHFTKVLALGDCYVLNPTLGPGGTVGDPPCIVGEGIPRPVPVTQSTWSSVKALFR